MEDKSATNELDDEVELVRQELSLKTLQTYDRNIIKIMKQTAFVSVYTLNEKLKRWFRAGVEGFLHIVQRNCSPKYQLIVLNQRHTKNLFEDITEDWEVNSEANYFFYRVPLDNSRIDDGNSKSDACKHKLEKTKRVSGLWFFDITERIVVESVIKNIINELQQSTDSKVEQNYKVVPSMSNCKTSEITLISSSNSSLCNKMENIASLERGDEELGIRKFSSVVSSDFLVQKNEGSVVEGTDRSTVLSKNSKSIVSAIDGIDNDSDSVSDGVQSVRDDSRRNDYQNTRNSFSELSCKGFNNLEVIGNDNEERGANKDIFQPINSAKSGISREKWNSIIDNKKSSGNILNYNKQDQGDPEVNKGLCNRKPLMKTDLDDARVAIMSLLGVKVNSNKGLKERYHSTLLSAESPKNGKNYDDLKINDQHNIDSNCINSKCDTLENSSSSTSVNGSIRTTKNHGKHILDEILSNVLPESSQIDQSVPSNSTPSILYVKKGNNISPASSCGAQKSSGTKKIISKNSNTQFEPAGYLKREIHNLPESKFVSPRSAPPPKNMEIFTEYPHEKSNRLIKMKAIDSAMKETGIQLAISKIKSSSDCKSTLLYDNDDKMHSSETTVAVPCSLKSPDFQNTSNSDSKQSNTLTYPYCITLKQPMQSNLKFSQRSPRCNENLIVNDGNQYNNKNTGLPGQYLHYDQSACIVDNLKKKNINLNKKNDTINQIDPQEASVFSFNDEHVGSEVYPNGSLASIKKFDSIEVSNPIDILMDMQSHDSFETESNDRKYPYTGKVSSQECVTLTKNLLCESLKDVLSSDKFFDLVWENLLSRFSKEDNLKGKGRFRY